MLKGLNRNLIYLFALNTAFGVAMQLVNPLFPLFLAEVGANEVQNATVISIGGLVATVLMLPSGLLIDRIGKKPMLVASAAVNAAAIFLLAFARNWVQVIPVYVFFSAASALFVPARMAMITENSESSGRASVFGLMNMAWPIAGVVSPLISGYLIESSGWSWVFYFGAAVNAVSLLPGLKIQRRPREIRENAPKGNFRDLFRADVFPVLFAFFGFHLFMTTALGAVNLVFPLYLASDYGLSASQIGLFFTAQSVLNLLTQVPSGSLAERYGKKRFILVCIAAIPVLYASWYWLSDWRLLLVANSVAFGLWSMTWPATLALLTDNVPSELVGAAFGVRMTGVRLGFTVGPLIGSFFYLGYGHTVPFLVSGAVCLVGVLFAFLLKEKVAE